MAFAREIIQRILQIVRFRVPNTGEKDSYYTTIGNSLVRISNHCTYMYVWDNYLEKNPKCNSMNIVSIVFEDNDDTFHPNCLVLKRDRKKPIVVEEIVYPLHGNANYLTKDEEKAIIKSLKAIGTTNKYKEVTGKGIANKRISINPTSQNVSVDIYGNNVYTTDNGHGADFISESVYNYQEIKENKIMNKKQVVRINENQLRQIVTESVKRMLNEGYFLDKDRYDFDYSPQHNKEIDTLSQAGEYDTSAGVLSKEMDEAPGIINDAMRLLSLLIPSKLGVSKSRVSKQIQSAIELLNKNKSMIVNAVLNSMTEFDRNANGALSSHIDKEITKRTW